MTNQSQALLSNHILHKALCTTHDITWGFNENEFLTNVIYLSIFLEKYILHENLTVREQLNIKTPDSEFFPKLDNAIWGRNEYKIKAEKQFRESEEEPIDMLNSGSNFKGESSQEEDFDETNQHDTFNEYYELEDEEEEEDDDDDDDSELFDIESDVEELLDEHFRIDEIDLYSTFSYRLKNNPVFHDFDNSIIKFRPLVINNFLDQILNEQLTEGAFDFHDAYFQLATEQAKYAIINKFSFIPDNTIVMQEAIKHIDKLNEVNTSKLVKEYENLSNYYKGEILKLVRYGAKKKLFIPPLTAIIFDRAQKPENIFEVAKEVRAEFSDLRNMFTAYEMKIKDDTLSLKESLSALNELETAFDKMVPKDDEKLITQVGEWRDITSLLNLLDGLALGDISSIAKFGLGTPLAKLAKSVRNRKIRYLSVLNKNFLDIKDYGRLIEKVFKKEISSNHIKNAKANGFANLFLI